MPHIDPLTARTLIVGAGVTGRSVARHLDRLGAHYDIADESAGRNEQASPTFTRLEATITTTAELIVLSPGVPRAHPAIAAAVDAGVPVIGDIELFARAVGAPVIAVTGSNGKSTVVAWLAEVARAAGIRAVACGNIGEPALDALDDSVELYVLELSSYQLESTESLQSRASTVLNVSEDHLDRYDSIDSYAAVKRRIYRGAEWRVVNHDDVRTWPDESESLPAGGWPDAAILPDGDGSLSPLPPSLPVETRFSLRRVDNDDSQPTRWRLGGTSEKVYVQRDGVRLFDAADLALPGQHNLANALAVLALLESVETHDVDVTSRRVLQALQRFTGLPHRTQLIAESKGVRWYNDSKGTNVAASCLAIEAMPGPVLLIAGGMGKEADFSPLRQPVRLHVRCVLLIGVDAARLAEALDGCAELVHCETLQSAVVEADHRAQSGDVVLLSPACASFDQFDNFEHRGDCFVRQVDEVLAA